MVAKSPRNDLPKLRLVSSERGGRAGADEPDEPTAGADDARLVAALRRGEISAAGALHDRVRPQVDRTIRRLLGGSDNDHEDLAQMALIELIYKIDQYRGECSLDTWASTLTAHLVYNHLRRRQTERQLFARMLAPEDLPTASRHRTGREAMGRSAVKRVGDHLDTLDANRAWTFMLHDALGYDLREVARITGVSVAAAQTRLVRGRRELHERIAQDAELANTLQELEGCE